MKRLFKMSALSLFAVLFYGCLPHEKLTGRVIDTAGPVPEAAVLGMVWIEDAGKARPKPDIKDLKPEDRDAAMDKDMKDRGLPAAYARTFSDKDGWFTLDNYHFSTETKKAVKAMKQPRISRVTMWAFQRGYRKQAVTLFPEQEDKEIPRATLLLFETAGWKELYLDNMVNTLTQPYMVKGYSKEFGATEQEKDWLLKYTHSNLWKAYVDSDIKGDKELEGLCGRDYSNIIVSTAGIRRNPEHERCADLIKRMGAVREIEELWIAHIRKSGNPLATAKEVVKRGIALLQAEANEPVEYESLILAGLEDAANTKNKGAMRNGLSDRPWGEEAKAKYGKGDKAAAYRELGYVLYDQLPDEIREGVITAQLSVKTIPGIKETVAGFYLLMNKPLTAQLPNGDNGNLKDKPGYKVEGATEAIGTGDIVPVQQEAIGKAVVDKTIPAFVPAGKRIYRKISDRVVITDSGSPDYSSPEKIYFGDKTGKKIKEYSVFPSDTVDEIVADIADSHTGKYIVVNSAYSVRVKPGTEADLVCYDNSPCKTEEVFTVLNDSGEVLWKTKGDRYQYILASDDGKVILGHLTEAVLDIYTATGKHLMKIQISDWAEPFDPESSDNISSKGAISGNGKYLVFSRTGGDIGKPEEDRRREIIFCDMDGNVLWRDMKQKTIGGNIFISPQGNYVAATRVTGLSSDAFHTYVDMLDKKGELLWSKEVGNFGELESVKFDSMEKVVRVWNADNKEFVFDVGSGNLLGKE